MLTDNITVVDYSGKNLTNHDIQECITGLRQLILDDCKWKTIPTNDTYLLRFLHCEDFNVALAFKRVQEFHNLVLEYPDWFVATSPLERKQQIQTNAKTMLSERDKEGRSIFVFRLGEIDMQTCTPQELAQIEELWYETVLDDPKTQATGISIIIDLKGYSLKLVKWQTPRNLKIYSKTMNLIPCKDFVIHVVNTSFLISCTKKLVWPFLSEKIRKKIKLHCEDWASLHNHISPEVLPPEYGGCGPAINFTELNQSLFDQDAEIRKKLEYRKL